MIDHEVIIVGGGFSGIGAAIALGKAGFDDYLMVEAGDGVGGAWHWNTYPGVAVDIPSFSYQFSYEKSARWSRVYAPGSELKAYAEHLVDKYDVRRRTRFNTRIEGAEFDDATDTWTLTTDGGETLTTRHVVGATGVFSQPQAPRIDGIDNFAGTVMHTARWDHSVDLRGRRVLLIGTGASAVQTVPSIAPEVEHLTVFQRTPIWCLPKPDGSLDGPMRWALRRVPGFKLATRVASQIFVELNFPVPAHYYGVVPVAKGAERIGLAHLRRQVRDPETREKLTPKYALGCKRPGFSNDYLRTFNRDNVSLETTPIERVTPTGIVTADGVSHDADVLILATGFKVFELGNMPPFTVRGSGGLDLAAFWDEHRFQAYQGVSVPRFPNLFTILGPYGYNGSSYFHLIETQMKHIVRCLREARRTGATRVEVTQAALDRFLATVRGRRDNQVFFQPSCANANSYYFDKHGDVPFRPAFSLETLWTSTRFDLGDYAFTTANSSRTLRSPVAA